MEQIDELGNQCRKKPRWLTFLLVYIFHFFLRWKQLERWLAVPNRSSTDETDVLLWWDLVEPSIAYISLYKPNWWCTHTGVYQTNGLFCEENSSWIQLICLLFRRIFCIIFYLMLTAYFDNCGPLTHELFWKAHRAYFGIADAKQYFNSIQYVINRILPARFDSYPTTHTHTDTHLLPTLQQNHITSIRLILLVRCSILHIHAGLPPFACIHVANVHQIHVHRNGINTLVYADC